MKGRTRPDLAHAHVLLPPADLAAPPPAGSRDRLLALGAERFARWMAESPRVLVECKAIRVVAGTRAENAGQARLFGDHFTAQFAIREFSEFVQTLGWWKRWRYVTDW